MCCYAGKLLQQPAMKNPTLVRGHRPQRTGRATVPTVLHGQGGLKGTQRCVPFNVLNVLPSPLTSSPLTSFSTVLVVMLLRGGLRTNTTAFQTIGPLSPELLGEPQIDGRDVIPAADGWEDHSFVRLDARAGYDVFRIEDVAGTGQKLLRQAQSVRGSGDNKFVDGAPNGTGQRERQLRPVGHLSKLPKGRGKQARSAPSRSSQRWPAAK